MLINFVETSTGVEDGTFIILSNWENSNEDRSHTIQTLITYFFF